MLQYSGKEYTGNASDQHIDGDYVAISRWHDEACIECWDTAEVQFSVRISSVRYQCATDIRDVAVHQSVEIHSTGSKVTAESSEETIICRMFNKRCLDCREASRHHGACGCSRITKPVRRHLLTLIHASNDRKFFSASLHSTFDQGCCCCLSSP